MRNFSLIIGLFLITGNTSLTIAQEYTLEAAKNYALENHVSIANANYDVDIARKQIVEYRGIGLPQININGSFNNFLNLPVQVMEASFFNPAAPPGTLVSFRAGTDYSASADLQVNQLLFNGSYIIGLQAANYFAKFQESLSEITKEDVVYNVIQAYELASVAKANMSFADSMVLLTESLIEKQQHYLDLGLLLQEDMDQLKYSLLTAKQARTESQLQYNNAIGLLKFSMGFPMESDIQITQSPEDLMNSTASSGSLQSNLTYSMMEKQVKLSEYNLKNENMAYLPSLNAFFQHSYNAYRNEFNFFDSNEEWFDQTVWGLQLNVPVFAGGQRYSKTAQAKIRLMKDQNSLQQMEESLKLQETQAQNKLLSAKAKHELQKENVALARSIYQNEIEKDSIGKGNSMMVTQKYNQLIMAQSQLVTSMIELFQAQNELDKIYNNILQNR
jgi:outer membrane protein TolC